MGVNPPKNKLEIFLINNLKEQLKRSFQWFLIENQLIVEILIVIYYQSGENIRDVIKSIKKSLESHCINTRKTFNTLKSINAIILEKLIEILKH